MCCIVQKLTSHSLNQLIDIAMVPWKKFISAILAQIAMTVILSVDVL